MIKATPKYNHGLGWKPGIRNHMARRFEDFVRVPPTALPATCDLTSLVSTVKDQGSAGSCTAHGATSTFEALQIKRTGKYFLGDRLYEYRMSRILGGDFPGDNGATVADAIEATIKYGVAPETDWPYDPSAIDNTPPAKVAADALKDETNNSYLLDSTAGTSQTLQNIMTALAVTGLPVDYGTPVYEQIEEVGSDGVIDMPSASNPEIGGHSMMFCGYDANYIWTLNSWGQGWGKAFAGSNGQKFAGGLGLLPKAYVTTGLVSDCHVIAGETEIVPPPATHISFATTPVASGTAIFDVGSDSALWYATSAAGPYTSLGGVCTSAAAAVSRSAGSYDIFVRGSDGALWHRTLAIAWSSLGGQILAGTNPGVVAPDTNTMDVYVIGTDKALYHKRWTTAAGWTPSME